jgi:hypothetical protein
MDEGLDLWEAVSVRRTILHFVLYTGGTGREWNYNKMKITGVAVKHFSFYQFLTG